MSFVEVPGRQQRDPHASITIQRTLYQCPKLEKNKIGNNLIKY